MSRDPVRDRQHLPAVAVAGERAGDVARRVGRVVDGEGEAAAQAADRRGPGHRRGCRPTSARSPGSASGHQRPASRRRRRRRGRRAARVPSADEPPAAPGVGPLDDVDGHVVEPLVGDQQPRAVGGSRLPLDPAGRPAVGRRDVDADQAPAAGQRSAKARSSSPPPAPTSTTVKPSARPARSTESRAARRRRRKDGEACARRAEMSAAGSAGWSEEAALAVQSALGHRACSATAAVHVYHRHAVASSLSRYPAGLEQLVTHVRRPTAGPPHRRRRRRRPRRRGAGCGAPRAGHRVVGGQPACRTTPAPGRRPAPGRPGAPPARCWPAADCPAHRPDDVLPDLVARPRRPGAAAGAARGAHQRAVRRGGARPGDPRGALPLALHPAMTFTGPPGPGPAGRRLLRRHRARSPAPVAEALVVEMGADPSGSTRRPPALPRGARASAPTTSSPSSTSRGPAAPAGVGDRSGCSRRCSAPRSTTRCGPATRR